MKLKDLSISELETMTYDEIAYLVLDDCGHKMKLLELFQKVCKVLELPEGTVEERIADFFELLSINKKFTLLENGYWDLATNHQTDVVIEDEEDVVEEDEMLEDDSIYEEETEEDIFYDEELEDDTDDDLKDLVIIDEEENIQQNIN